MLGAHCSRSDIAGTLLLKGVTAAHPAAVREATREVYRVAEMPPVGVEAAGRTDTEIARNAPV
jgi:hypothetical protein